MLFFKSSSRRRRRKTMTGKRRMTRTAYGCDEIRFLGYL
jgi:hypothetical protein